MTFQQKTVPLIAQAQAALSENFSLSRLGTVVQQFLVDAMSIAGQELSKAGHEKKALVIAALSDMLDSIPLPMWLAIFRVPLKSIVLRLADGAIEAIYARFQEQLAHE
ncbi:hypothetical protein GC197_03325 [bacterium]|nr:hypothetical protein [bacterium]